MQSINVGSPSMGGGYSTPPVNNQHAQAQPQQQQQVQQQPQQQVQQQQSQPQPQPQESAEKPQTQQQQQPQQQVQQQKNTQNPQQRNRVNQTAMNQLAKAANKQLEAMNRLNRQFDAIPTFERSPLLEQTAPKFPETAFQRLSQMMESNQMMRNEVNKNFNRKLGDMKEKFFESYGYKTEQGADGKPKVALDQQGRPQLTNGKETFQQKVARQEYEEQNKKTYSDYQNSVKDSFFAGEKQKVQQFLQTHRNELTNPVIQQELQKMLAEIEKKTLKLKREFDEQLLMLDLPSEEMREFASKEAKKLQELEDQHKKMEDSTQEAHELIMYQEEMNAFAIEEKQKIHALENSEDFLNGKNALLKGPSQPTLAELLPPYIVTSLYNLGIYSID